MMEDVAIGFMFTTHFGKPLPVKHHSSNAHVHLAFQVSIAHLRLWDKQTQSDLTPANKKRLTLLTHQLSYPYCPLHLLSPLRQQIWRSSTPLSGCKRMCQCCGPKVPCPYGTRIQTFFHHCCCLHKHMAYITTGKGISKVVKIVTKIKTTINM